MVRFTGIIFRPPGQDSPWPNFRQAPLNSLLNWALTLGLPCWSLHSPILKRIPLSQFQQNLLPLIEIWSHSNLIGLLISHHPSGDVWSAWPVLNRNPVNRLVKPESSSPLMLPLSNYPPTDPSTLQLGCKVLALPCCKLECPQVLSPTTKVHCRGPTAFVMLLTKVGLTVFTKNSFFLDITKSRPSTISFKIFK